MEGKTTMQIWETMTNIFGDQGNITKVFGIKESWALQHFREHVVLLMGNKG